MAKIYKLAEESIDEWEDQQIEEIQNSIIKDPVGYFVDEEGMSIEDLAKTNFMQIDYTTRLKIQASRAVHFLAFIVAQRGLDEFEQFLIAPDAYHFVRCDVTKKCVWRPKPKHDLLRILKVLTNQFETRQHFCPIACRGFYFFKQFQERKSLTRLKDSG